MRFAVLVCLCLGVAGAAGAQDAPNWSYLGRNGPVNWGKLDPSYKACANGHQQSPIDIRGAHLNTRLTPLEFHYIGGPVTVENTGNTIVVRVDPGSWMMADGVRYGLQELVFHHPSEIAVRGKLDDMDVDLVHQSDDGKRAILSIRLKEDPGSPNAVLSTLWAHLPTRPGAKEQVAELVNPGGLLPADRGYWTFTGSLTEPPCTEGVRWFVMEQDLSISREQLRLFAGMFRISSRQLQDTHGRKIEANE